MKTAKHENRKRLKGRQANRKLEKRDKKYTLNIGRPHKKTLLPNTQTFITNVVVS